MVIEHQRSEYVDPSDSNAPIVATATDPSHLVYTVLCDDKGDPFPLIEQIAMRGNQPAKRQIPRRSKQLAYEQILPIFWLLASE